MVEPSSPRLFVTSPRSGIIRWSADGVAPIEIRGVAPAGTTAVHYTVHDKGIVMDQGTVTPGAGDSFTVTYDARALHEAFTMLSLVAHEGRWEGLADEVTISLFAEGGEPRANVVTLIGEEVFVQGMRYAIYLPLALRH